MKKDFLFCVDSDGCVFDTMTTKHRAAFGPALVEVYGLERIREKALALWEEINLTTATRGVNRFEGLALFFDRLEQMGERVPGTAYLRRWTLETNALGNGVLKSSIEGSDGEERAQLETALAWSEQVNERAEHLAVRPFDGVAQALALIAEFADIAVVSSANPEALRREWGNYGLDRYVAFMGHQGMGSKAEMLRDLAGRGYRSDRCVMCGDALGDLAAARETGMLFYPIMPFDEVRSWEVLRYEAAAKIRDGSYSAAEGEYVTAFEHKLKG